MKIDRDHQDPSVFPLLDKELHKPRINFMARIACLHMIALLAHCDSSDLKY